MANKYVYREILQKIFVDTVAMKNLAMMLRMKYRKKHSLRIQNFLYHIAKVDHAMKMNCFAFRVKHNIRSSEENFRNGEKLLHYLNMKNFIHKMAQVHHSFK